MSECHFPMYHIKYIIDVGFTIHGLALSNDTFVVR